tara:strand:+ start:839 stop:1486 length:648 start_codon:yes stop_codon:yes gene_type:complete
MMQIRTSNENAAEEFYRNAKREVESSKYSGEIAWQQSQCVSEISETDFLRESAWVIINSGFRESVARKCFGHISLSFHDWRSAEEIASDAETCISLALEGFSNVKKINAIGAVAQRVNGEGFDLVKSCTQNDTIRYLMSFPYIGPTTAWHLAKNLGCDLAKPDRHLVRLADRFGYRCVQEFCKFLSAVTQDKVNVVDIVLWRYCASLAGTVSPAG